METLQRAAGIVCGGLLLLSSAGACGDDGSPPEDDYRGPSGYGTTSGYGGTDAAPSVGGGGTAYDRGGGGPEEAKGPIPVALASDAVLVERLVVLDGNAATRLVDAGPLSVEGYYSVQISETGLPREGAAPSFRWSAEPGARVWPTEEVVSVPADGTTWLVAYLDLNGSGRLDTGDRAGLPSEPLAAGASDDPEERLTLRIDRIFVSIEPPRGGSAGRDRGYEDDGRGPPGEAGGPEGPDGPPDEDSNPPRQVTIEASSDQVAGEHLGGLLLLGFAGKNVSEAGLPQRGARAIWSYVRARGPLSWPVVAQMRLPEHGDLWVFPVLDLDGDGQLGDGDWFGVPGSRFNPPGDSRQPIQFGIDRQFESMEYEAGTTFGAGQPFLLEPNEPPARGCGS